MFQEPEPHLVRICVKYFAALREQSGKSEEWLETRATTLEELYQELESRYQFNLSRASVRAAVNSAYRDLQTPLCMGDVVTFIPPVAGG